MPSKNKKQNQNQQQPKQPPQHKRAPSFDEETQTKSGQGRLSSRVPAPPTPNNNTNNTDDTLAFSLNDDLEVVPTSPTAAKLDPAAFSLRLLSPSNVSIGDLIAALFLRIVSKKRFWTLVLILAVFVSGYHKNQEIREAGMKLYPSGMQIEEDDRPGLLFNSSKIKLQRPVVIIPGFITTGLDLWSGMDCILSDVSTNFRQRMFGTSMMLKLFQDPECYMKHLSLDPETGGDPDPRIKVRHGTGFDSVDYIDRSGIYWVWAKLMRNLADIGYEPKNMHVASYDWRMNPELAEERYGFFSRLKSKIQTIYESSGTTTPRTPAAYRMEKFPENEQEASPPGAHSQPKQRVVLVCHSYGTVIAREFLNWADQQESGWTDKFVHSVIGYGGPNLGIPKANAALASGEIKDTAALPSLSRRILDSHVLRRSRANLFRSWPCLATMLTRGPEKLFPNMIEFTSSSSASSSENESDSNSTSDVTTTTPFEGKQLDVTGSVTLIRQIAKASNNTRLAKFIHESASIRNVIPQFPVAKNTKFYCVYGVGLDTEVGYYYKQPEKRSSSSAADDDISIENDEKVIENYDMESIEFDFEQTSAVRLGDGDGTVPLMSLGYPCRSKKNGFARNLEKVVTVEMRHEPAPLDPRGGVFSGDHVDGMGNWRFLELVMKVVSGLEDEVKDVVSSEVDKRVNEIDDNEL